MRQDRSEKLTIKISIGWQPIQSQVEAVSKMLKTMATLDCKKSCYFVSAGSRHQSPVGWQPIQSKINLVSRVLKIVQAIDTKESCIYKRGRF